MAYHRHVPLRTHAQLQASHTYNTVLVHTTQPHTSSHAHNHTVTELIRLRHHIHIVNTQTLYLNQLPTTPLQPSNLVYLQFYGWHRLPAMHACAYTPATQHIHTPSPTLHRHHTHNTGTALSYTTCVHSLTHTLL